MNLCDIDVIRAVLGRHGFRFSKSLGQNFLTDASVPQRIAAYSGADRVGNVVEIGPGMGCLTAELCRRANKVIAVELDRALLPVLAETLAGFDNCEVVQGDVLALDLAALCREKFGVQGAVACANLPYYITTPAITALLESRAFETITVMVQREVAQRICAQPGTAAYGAFSIYVQYWAQPEILFDVPANCFVPQPKVDSAVLQLTPLAQPAVAVRDEKLFFALVRAAFNMRRKTLVNALVPLLGGRLDKAGIAALLESVGLDARVRGERLSLQEFAALADKVAELPEEV
ncbi:MAG: 16S rRNA (adenine(1518)-N(6)/adenine(1519)-N(6))-dimethyltransferase RsmA [Agathobaculum sp.]|uniref:16S rRNA (adenine(1518)-N(6)/adenine(1519)-N(6))- dimethyltransferase RsmA n=1 Tax=Agathobaculum sp. TaxID=2048138 RepID=UPI0025BBE73F|nr:16S rRNA (adenine(1518)-N(6)/adenine(1519)-N(6))-dimethyltransferase RsmA [Agathobaculum sp.]MCI7126158.1 16S rRNA (adenine(1518)-N(6)/adenine(1519)-N(6))-dimethyltransferase RsmA [Agathobaculum sp.]MDY3711345.1 16S rRNA (adenine(1518)-N(6)/adenine(1519)-N(6))-dimethyltransferase RsmA [Agathobaculum sp.]